ncbi:AraC family transcriptional regulator [Ramlibacter sp. G-1-2-2]|uniref:AraC family transcriptional regulator n=1 Tax=Ramlibacter agri TaxID=2728837 RepID=A0A848H5J3_9BURK|nr:AraC family transcriptional regulator [Ramlibacter agri]NML44530.1 AraC family transcriptional regulator [Ramlibacter agri]
MGPLIRSTLLVKFTETAKRVGVDAADMFRHVGADLQCLGTPELLVPERWLAGMLDATERRTGFVSVGLAMAETWRMADNGPLALLLQHQPTLRHALGHYESYRHLRSETVTFRLFEFGELAVIRLELETERALPGRQPVELTLGSLMSLLRWCLGPAWKPREVRFTHAAPRELDVHARVFGCPVEFGCDFDCIVLKQADLDHPNPHGDVRLARFAKELLDYQPHGMRALTTLAVQRNLKVLLPKGRCSIAEVASQLGTSARTLQRRLEHERTEFSAVTNDVRRSLASLYLSDARYPVSQVATLLGFSEPSAFSRWFGAQFGQSPREWRAGAVVS